MSNQKHSLWLSFFTALLTLLTLGACAAEPTPTPRPSRTPTTTPSATPTRRPTATPRPSPTIPTAELIVVPQSIENDGLLTVQEVIMPTDGWLVVYRESDGELSQEDVVGVVPLPAGTTPNLLLELDQDKLVPNLQIALHAGTGTFDPTAELLLIENFRVDINVVRASITAQDQEVLKDGLLTIAEIDLDRPGWVAVYNQTEAGLGEMLGYAPVAEGINQNVGVFIRWAEANPAVTAVIHADEGERGAFEESDPILQAGELPVQAEIALTLPPEVVVLDQPIVDGKFMVERVVVSEPTWLVAYQDIDGIAGFILGSVLLRPGLNERVEVEVTPANVTDRILVTLHEDSTAGDEFDFPTQDPPLQYQGKAFFFYFNTTINNYIMVADQVVSGEGQNVVVIPAAASEANVWLVIHAENEANPEELGEILGQIYFPAGAGRDLEIEIDPAGATLRVWAVFHQDVGEAQQFEPEVDTPIVRRRAPLGEQFLLYPVEP